MPEIETLTKVQVFSWMIGATAYATSVIWLLIAPDGGRSKLGPGLVGMAAILLIWFT